MKIVYQAENIIDANLVKNALEAAGIVAFVSGQYLTGAAGELPLNALVNVMVAQIDWPKARAIAERIDAALCERRSDPALGDADFDDGCATKPI
ncbi:MAG: DUF2007 domain-containing protein [Rudaea sp.]